MPENQRADAANSLVYEANVRIRDPVYGCMGAIAALQQQLHSLQAQLDTVRSEILKHDIMRSQAVAAAVSSVPGSTETTSNNNKSIITSAVTAATSHHQHHLMRSSSGILSAVAAVMPIMLPPQTSSSTDLPQRPLTPPLNQVTAHSVSSNSSSSLTNTSTAMSTSSIYSTTQNNSNSIRFAANDGQQGGYMCFD